MTEIRLAEYSRLTWRYTAVRPRGAEFSNGPYTRSTPVICRPETQDATCLAGHVRRTIYCRPSRRPNTRQEIPNERDNSLFSVICLFFLTAWVLFYVGRRDILKSRQKWQSTWLAVVNTLTVVSVGKCVSALSFVTFASISKAITCQDRWDVTEQFHHSARFLCRHVEHRMTNCHTLWRQFVAF